MQSIQHSPTNNWKTRASRCCFSALFALTLFGVMACDSGTQTGPLLGGGSNTITVIGSQAALSYPGPGGGTVAHVTCTGYDSQGTVVYQSEEVPHSGEMSFTEAPGTIAKIQLDYNRGTGYALSQHKQDVNMNDAVEGVLTLRDIKPAALDQDRDTFTVRIVNKSKFADSKVFITVFGKNFAEKKFFYVKFGKNDTNVPTAFNMVNAKDDKDKRAEQYSVALNELTQAGTDDSGRTVYSFQCPYKDNLVSGRIFISFGNKLLGLGMECTDNDSCLRTPSSTGSPDYQTLYEFIELSATRPKPTKDNPNPAANFTLFTNTSVVDFFSIGMQMTMEHHDSTNKDKDYNKNIRRTVGFEDGARKNVLAAFDALKKDADLIVFQNYMMSKDGKTILRVLSPSQVVGWPGAGNYATMIAYLDGVIAEGWKYYQANLLTINDTVKVPNDPTFIYGYQYTPQLITKDGVLSMTCTVAPSSDTASKGEVCKLPTITSSIAFKCDADDPPKDNFPDSYTNKGTDGHKRLVSFIGAALNRGVFENYADWGDPSKFYQRTDKKYNYYSKIMHDYALEVVDEKGNKVRRVYGFPYDDIYGQDPTLSRAITEVNHLLLTIPDFDFPVDANSQIGANIRSMHGKRATIFVGIGATVLALAILGGIAIYRRRRTA